VPLGRDPSQPVRPARARAAPSKAPAVSMISTPDLDIMMGRALLSPAQLLLGYARAVRV
jgi:hypothetical protein